MIHLSVHQINALAERRMLEELEELTMPEALARNVPLTRRPTISRPSEPASSSKKGAIHPHAYPVKDSPTKEYATGAPTILQLKNSTQYQIHRGNSRSNVKSQPAWEKNTHMKNSGTSSAWMEGVLYAQSGQEQVPVMEEELVPQKIAAVLRNC